MTGRTARRGLLGGAGLLLAGCGFRPLYGPRPEAGGEVTAELSAIRVGLVPNRRGQIVRQELQRRLALGAAATAARYELRVGLLPGSTLQNFRRDGTPGRVNLTLSAPWSLVTLAVPPETVASGSATAFDAYNIPDNQFFAGLQANEAAERRLIEQVAEDIVTRLVLAFRDRRAA